MEFTDVKEWLDWHIRNIEENKKMERLNSRVYMTCTLDYVYLGAGIDIVADVMGLDLVYDGKIEEYYRYYFMYKGVEFSQLSRERMGKHDGTD